MNMHASESLWWGVAPAGLRSRVDWERLAAWTASILFCLVFWVGLVWMIVWAVR